jgi:hypothetical protein
VYAELAFIAVTFVTTGLVTSILIGFVDAMVT